MPAPSETPVEVIVSGRTSTLKQITIVEVGQEIPENHAGALIRNTPGFRWYVSRHYAMKTNLSDDEARYYLTVSELAYPHFAWVFGQEPPGMETMRMATVYAKSLADLQEAVKTDLGTHWAGSGGGVTLHKNRVSYNYPSGGLRYHRRDLVIHEHLHMFQMCLSDATRYTPPHFTEGITHALANHVYDRDKKQLTVMVLDKATTNNMLDKGLEELKKNFVTVQNFIDQDWNQNGYVGGVYTQFFWTDPDRLMKWRLWRDELLRLKVEGDRLKETDAQLMASIFGDLEELNTQWKTWCDRRHNSFHYADWGWEQSGDTLWSYGWPQSGKYAQTDIRYAPQDAPEYDPLRMDWPLQPMSPLVGPVKRGTAEPTIGCLVEMSDPQYQGLGTAGIGLGVDGRELVAVLVQDAKELLIDGLDVELEGFTLSGAKKAFPFSDAFREAAKDCGYRVGLTIKIARDSLEITARTGRSGKVCTLEASVPLLPDQRNQLMTRPMAVLSSNGRHGLTPYIDDARRAEPVLTIAAHPGRWRFAGEEALYELYRAAWQLGDKTPASLTVLKDTLARAADKDPATQQAAMETYRTEIENVKKDISKHEPLGKNGLTTEPPEAEWRLVDGELAFRPHRGGRRTVTSGRSAR
ncbi:MAG: hypothetical protein JJ992_11800 [Planctomycetes bacterium]|nr:hypothetical protein [Planctomycetota bacterium]